MEPGTDKGDTTLSSEVFKNKAAFMEVAKSFEADTAKLADIVLPSSTFLERQDTRDYRSTGDSLFTVSNKAIEPQKIIMCSDGLVEGPILAHNYFLLIPCKKNVLPSVT